MNILIISCVFPPEPVVSAKLSHDIAVSLSEKGDVVTVVSPKPTRPYKFKFELSETNNNFEHIILDSYTCPQSNIAGRLIESYSFGKKCSKYIRENRNKIDKIYLNSWPLFSQYFIVKEAKKHNIPSIVHVMDIYPESLTNKISIGSGLVQKTLLPIDKYILRNTEKVICISENMKQHLSQSRDLPVSKLHIVHNWQDEESFITFKNNNLTANNDEMPFTFMYLGNNGPVAGVEFLIQSFVDANIKNSQLIVAGGGSRTEACKKLADRLGATNVKFILVPDGKVPEIQSKADVMLLPVKKGGAMSSIPSKLPAYMFSAKPIIGSLDEISDTAKAIIDADCGIVVSPENKNELIAAMRNISVWAKSVLEEKGENGFNYAMKYFSRSRNLEKLIRIVKAGK
jgi:glycosyltransferase involved in cell wall biosynthesis